MVIIMETLCLELNLLSTLHLLQEEWIFKKKSSVSLVIMDMQINMKRCHFSPVKPAKIFKLLLSSVDKGVGKQALWHSVGGSVNWFSFLEYNVPRCIINLNFCICMSLGVFSNWKKRSFKFYREYDENGSSWLYWKIWLRKFLYENTKYRKNFYW